MMTKERSTKIINLMTPGEGILCRGMAICHKVKMQYLFLKHSSLLPGIDQSNLEYSNDDHGRSTLIVNYMTSEKGFLC